jgi:hypothetical protein
LADRVGLRYLAQLLAVPNRSVSALALVIEGQATTPVSKRQHVLDERAVRALRERIGDLRQKHVLTDQEREELESLTRELGRTLGFRGRFRSFADVPERARTAVRKAIARAIEDISIADATIGQHLSSSVSTGTTCVYCARHNRPQSAAR